MNNNKNNILNKLPKKQHTVFLIVIIILILTFVIFIIRNHLKHDEYKQRFVKNVFFVEMDDPTKTPFDASKANSDKYELDRTICVRGKSRNKYISNRALHIKLPYSMTFWFNINSDLVGQYLNNKNNSRTKYPLVYFSDNQYKKNKSGTTNNQNLLPGINMNIINNALEIIVSICSYDSDTGNPLEYTYEGDNKTDNDEKACGSSERLYNIPNDTWNCLTTIVNSNHLNLYLNGKLMKVIEYNSDVINKDFKNYKLYIGPFPGEIGYLQVDNDENNFTSDIVYKEYLFYKAKVDKYIKSQYHKNYKVSTLTDHSNYDFSSYHRRPREDRSNKCN